MAIERTFAMVKPDGVKRQLIGKIISRFEDVGLKIVAMKMYWPNKEEVDGFYPSDESWLREVGEKAKKGYSRMGLDIKEDFGTEDEYEIGKKIKQDLVNYISSGPIVAMVLEGNNAVSLVRKIVGNTEPYSADPSTIRGYFSSVSYDLANKELKAVMNIIHASSSKEEAEREIKYWFDEKEIYKYETGTDLVYKQISSYIKENRS